MRVKRVVPNLTAADVSKAKQFYAEVLGLEVVMDQGSIRDVRGTLQMTPQISIASEGGSGTAVPDISVEVDDLEEALRCVSCCRFHRRVRPDERTLARAPVLRSRSTRPAGKRSCPRVVQLGRFSAYPESLMRAKYVDGTF